MLAIPQIVPLRADQQIKMPHFALTYGPGMTILDAVTYGPPELVVGYRRYRPAEVIGGQAHQFLSPTLVHFISNAIQRSIGLGTAVMLSYGVHVNGQLWQTRARITPRPDRQIVLAVRRERMIGAQQVGAQQD